MIDLVTQEIFFSKISFEINLNEFTQIDHGSCSIPFFWDLPISCRRNLYQGGEQIWPQDVC